MKVTPDIFASIYFYHTQNGGEKYPIRADYREHFGCPATFEKSKREESLRQRYDCRVYLQHHPIINPGDVCNQLPIKFLFWELVQPLLTINKQFYLWEAGMIGEVITEIILPASGTEIGKEILKFRLQALLDSLMRFLNYHDEKNWSIIFDSYLKKFKLAIA